MIQQGPLKLFFSFLGPKDSFSEDPVSGREGGKAGGKLSL